jgi:predicted kinase
MQSSLARFIVVFFGMTASGKSTLGKAWAAQYAAPYYNTDQVRKELAGLRASDRRPDRVGFGIYGADLTEKTYRTLLGRAGEDLAAGKQFVVLDGSYSRRGDRDRVRDLAARYGAKSVFVFCTCSEAAVRHRLALRAKDPEAVSDGRWEIYQHQQATFERPDDLVETDCLRLNTEQPVADMIAWLTAQLCAQR